MRPRQALLGSLLAVGLVPAAYPQAVTDTGAAAGYRTPAAPLARFLERPLLPLVATHPQGDVLLLVHRERLPPLQHLLAAESPARATAGDINRLRYTGLTLVHPRTGVVRAVALPADARVGFPVWSPDGSRFAFALSRAGRVELWLGQAAGAAATRVAEGLNIALGAPCRWMPDNRRLLCRLHVADSARTSGGAPVPAGPRVWDSRRPRRGAAATLRDDARLGSHPLRARLALVDVRSGAANALGEPGIFSLAEPSPDGAFVLIARALPPHAAATSAAQLPQSVEIWGLDGRRLRFLALLPAATLGRSSASPALPRGFAWRSALPAAVVWVEPFALGAPRAAFARRDRVLMLPAPFAGPPVELLRTQHRFAGLQWVEQSDLALVSEYDRRARWRRRWLIEAQIAPAPPRLVWEHGVDEPEASALRPLARTNGVGQAALLRHEGAIYLLGETPSAAGPRSFIDRLPLDTLQRERVWQAQGSSYETAIQVLAPATGSVLLRRESPREPPHYMVHDWREGDRVLVAPTQPSSSWPGFQQREVRYRRADGVDLSALLYLPGGHPPGQPLPLLMWVYPRNYGDPDLASQTRVSTQRFPPHAGLSALRVLPALCGYAVLDQVAMPVVGEHGNDTFLAQVRDGAQAAVDAVVALGIADPARIAIAGHSYGAFVVANLLAHTDLFRAGVAMSGAYNRTLTPFGFQTEQRSLWQAPDTYLALSPFLFADRIRAPLLLVHGEQDERPGTPAMQSRRLFAAIRHHGGTARLVILPHEGHVYRARESMLHVAAELVDWLERHVRGAYGAGVEPGCSAQGERTAGAALIQGPDPRQRGWSPHAPRAGHGG